MLQEKKDSWLAHEVFRMKERHEDLKSQINELNKLLSQAKDALNIIASGELPDGHKIDHYTAMFASSTVKNLDKEDY